MATILALVLAAAAPPVQTAHAVVAVRAPQRTYELRGTLVLRHGYVLRARGTRSPFARVVRISGAGRRFDQLLRGRLRSGRLGRLDRAPRLRPRILPDATE